MRKAALDTLFHLAGDDPRITLVGTDMKHGACEAFHRAFPDRFFMEGISEGHVIGMAAGLALEGNICYVAGNATFLLRRPYEQVVLDLCLNRAPVRILGHGAGMLFSPLGPSHTIFEDLSICRALPGLTAIAPCDIEEMRRLIPLTVDWPGPIYIRCSKGNTPVISSDSAGFAIGKAIDLRPGGEVLFVSTGIGAQVAMEAAAMLEADGIDAGVLHMHTVKPLDTESLLNRASSARIVVSVEEHSIVGGLGSAAAEALMEGDLSSRLRFRRFGLPDAFQSGYGEQLEQLAKAGFTAEGLRGLVLELQAGGGRP